MHGASSREKVEVGLKEASAGCQGGADDLINVYIRNIRRRFVSKRRDTRKAEYVRLC